MIKKLKNYKIILLSLAVLLAPMLVPLTASAAPDNIQGCVSQGTDIENGPFSDDPTGNCTPHNVQAQNSDLNKIIKDVVNMLTVFVGLIAIIMIIVGGFKYITSGGATEGMTSAKHTIIYALVGLVIVALAQFIVHFVLNKVTSEIGSSVLSAFHSLL